MTRPGKYGPCVECGAPANYWCLQTRRPVCGKPCKLRHLQRVTDLSAAESAVATAPAASAAPAPPGPALPNPAAATGSGLAPAATGNAGDFDASIDATNTAAGVVAQEPEFAHVLQKDAYLVFRALCKLSMRNVADLQDPRSHELRSKLFSLELLLNIMQNSGTVFQNSEHFISAVKQYLVLSVSRNGVSPIGTVFELSLAIFLSLLQHFKRHLKPQIEVFFKDIFLSILESPTSSLMHKRTVLYALAKICADPQTIVDLYVNYDCDLALDNIFERLVNDLSRIAQARSTLDTPAAVQHALAIRTKGLECLVAILHSLVQWIRELTDQDIHAREQQAQQLRESFAGMGGGLPIAAVTSAPLPPPPGATTSRPDEAGATGVHAAAPTQSERRGADPAAVLAPGHRVLADIALAARGGTADAAPRPVADAGAAVATPAVAANGAPGDSASGAPTDVVDEQLFEELKRQKELYERGLEKFHEKPRKGIAFLQENGLLGRTPADVSRFLLTTDRLNKALVGEYLGDNDPYNIEVMYAYVDAHDMTGQTLVEALRRFLSGFRLPGEAQKIDRLMEKFAQRYCENNPQTNVFANADTAYVLAYSIIMLTTDLHNPQVRKKMTMEEFVRNNRGINDSKDLPREYLESIYREIEQREIKVKGERPPVKPPTNEPMNERQRKDLYSKEMEIMLEAAQERLLDETRTSSTFLTAKLVEHARPMFKVTWASALAAFSVNLKTSDDPRIVQMCLDGFRYAIRISSIFGMELERDAFVQSLAKFTYLTGASISEIKHKNVEAIKTLIGVAHSEGNYLQSSWHEVLRCISQLEFAQLIGGGLRGSALAPMNTAEGASRIAATVRARPGALPGPDSLGDLASLRNMDKDQIAHLQEAMDETASQSVLVAVDRVFTGSIYLKGEPIEDFVRWLCVVSLEELQPPSPRMFCLQKIVEICYYNMGRIRLEWSRIWAIIGDYFNKVGCMPNLDVAMFAVDSLRQLSMKFLEKGELGGFHFQKDFLKPFEYIMSHNKNVAIRDMVVRCLAQMVQSKARNIRSGWKNIFYVFSLAAGDEDEAIVSLAFRTAQCILEDYFRSTGDSFMDAMNSLTEFACNPHFFDINMEAIKIVRDCAARVAASPELFRSDHPAVQRESSATELATPADGDASGSVLSVADAESDDRYWVRGWFPVVFGLTRIISRCKLDIRTRALTVLFEILKTYGGQFRQQWWKDLFRIISRLYDDLKQPEAQQEVRAALRVHCFPFSPPISASQCR